MRSGKLLTFARPACNFFAKLSYGLLRCPAITISKTKRLSMQPQSVARTSLLAVLLVFPIVAHAQVLGDPADVSQDFQKLENVYFIGSRVSSFDASTGQGILQWDRYLRNTTLSFNKIDVGFTRGRATEFP